MQNKFFDPSTPSMRKGDDGEKKKIMMKIVATNVVASRPPERQGSPATTIARANLRTFHIFSFSIKISLDKTVLSYFGMSRFININCVCKTETL